eukprot:2269747-Alexandrium_andersonii.AAC.1
MSKLPTKLAGGCAGGASQGLFRPMTCQRRDPTWKSKGSAEAPMKYLLVSGGRSPGSVRTPPSPPWTCC